MKLLKEENGAVTVDWVVLCAALFFLVSGIATTTQQGLERASFTIASSIDGTIE